MVKSLTFLDVEPFALDLKIHSLLQNWQASDLQKQEEQSVSKRADLVGYANGVGVPFGLMGFTVSDQLAEEARWYYLTEKYWKSEDHYSKLISKSGDMSGQLNSSIFVYLLVTNNTDEQVRVGTCGLKGYRPDSDECLYELAFNRASVSERVNLSFGSTNKQVAEIGSSYGKKMGFDYLIGRGAETTVEKLLEFS